MWNDPLKLGQIGILIAWAALATAAIALVITCRLNTLAKTS